MSPEESESFLDLENQGPPTGGLPPVQWFEAAEGLFTVRGLLSVIKTDPTMIARDSVSETTVPARRRLDRTPKRSAVIEDLEDFEAVLSRLAAEGIRWHMAIDL